jgi:hypothetical protein
VNTLDQGWAPPPQGSKLSVPLLQHLCVYILTEPDIDNLWITPGLLIHYV